MARDATKPPGDVTAARLFRLLCSRERARFSLTYRLPCAPWLPLECRALGSREFQDALEADDDGTALLVSAAWCRGRPLFASADDVGKLYATEFVGLRDAVLDGLAVVSPVSRRIDQSAWHRRLVEGAGGPGNSTTAALMALSFDTVVGYAAVHRTPRPDRFYGLPLCDLTDGQVLAFRAGAEIGGRRHDG